MISSDSAVSSRIGSALLVLRVVLGVIMAAHGYQKLFIFGFAGVTGGFAQMGIPMATLIAPCVSLLEFVGGIALILGLFTRLAALGIALDMLGALVFVHFKNGFFLPTGFEFVLALIGMSIAIAVAGAGDLSADAAIERRRAASASEPVHAH
jgi:putative oxidoreductase